HRPLAAGQPTALPGTRLHCRSVIVAPTPVQQNSPLIWPIACPDTLTSNRQLCPTPSVDPIAQFDGLREVFGLGVISAVVSVSGSLPTWVRMTSKSAASVRCILPTVTRFREHCSDGRFAAYTLAAPSAT